jgi:hypothetical protein
MRCPKYNQIVDPEASDSWLIFLDIMRKESRVTPLTVLLAVQLWDKSTMFYGGQSTLPTELRDAIANVVNTPLAVR